MKWAGLRFKVGFFVLIVFCFLFFFVIVVSFVGLAGLFVCVVSFCLLFVVFIVLLIFFFVVLLIFVWLIGFCVVFYDGIVVGCGDVVGYISFICLF